MRRAGLLLLCAGLQACSFTQPAAPIRDAARHPRLVRHPLPPIEDKVVVQPGDTLFRIAFDHGLDYRELAQWNGLDNPSMIRVGEVLRLKPPPPERLQAEQKPPPEEITHTEKVALETGPALESKPEVKTKVESEPVQPASHDFENSEVPPASWVWPAKGQVVTEFNDNTGAKGIDIAGKLDSLVVAAAAGRVIYAGAGLRGYGKLIIIKHSRILLSAYGHNDKVLVTEGQTVQLGQPIAEMGNTDADRVKLHFEIREYGKPVDPLTYLPGSPG
jgi:lipoprotein NlpD